MRSKNFDVTLSSDEYGFEGEQLTFRYTEKEGKNWEVQRYQLNDKLGVIFTGEKVWRQKDKKGFLGLWTSEKREYQEEVKKRVAYDKSISAVITEEASWEEFREILRGTEAQQYLV